MFEVLKGKNGRGDRYFNLNSIQSFYTYFSRDGIRSLTIIMLNRSDIVLSDTYYEIDDFIDRVKRKEAMPV